MAGQLTGLDGWDRIKDLLSPDKQITNLTACLRSEIIGLASTQAKANGGKTYSGKNRIGGRVKSVMKPSLNTALICCLFVPWFADQTPRTPTKTASVTGTYTYILNTIDVLELPDHKVRISFAGVYPNSKKRAETRNVGTFDETVHLVDRSATVKLQYQKEPCTITLKFLSNKLVVEQGGSLQSCGFGFNVEADGTYLKTSSKPPNLKP